MTGNVRSSPELASSLTWLITRLDLAIWGEGSVDRDPVAFPAPGRRLIMLPCARRNRTDRLHEPTNAIASRTGSRSGSARAKNQVATEHVPVLRRIHPADA